jgi:hypothetical protein
VYNGTSAQSKADMIVGSHQPNYLPNLAFFSKMKMVDHFVVITNLQFEKHERWQQRHKIHFNGADHWLTVPIYNINLQMIKDVMINQDNDWRRKHKLSIQSAYGKTADKDVLQEFLGLYDHKWERLAYFNFAIIQKLKDILDIKTPLVMDHEVEGRRHQLLVNVAKKYNADQYLSGVGARHYLTEEMIEDMAKQGVEHRFVDRNLTAEYPYSTVHYLFTKGVDWVRDVI